MKTLKHLSQTTLWLTALAAIIIVSGCATVATMKTAGTKAGPLAKILVYVGEVPLGESGRSASGTEINRGGTVVFSAQGRDAQGNPIPVEPTWTPSKPGIVEITPPVGAKVVVRGLAEGTIDIFLEYAGVKSTVELVAVR